VNDLNDEQKALLYLRGAVSILYWTGELKRIGAVESREIVIELMRNGTIKWIGGSGSDLENVSDLVFEKREVYAIASIVAKAAQSDQREFFIIDGLNHQLQDYSKKNLTIIREPILENVDIQYKFIKP
jgi:hypothetical protein